MSSRTCPQSYPQDVWIVLKALMNRVVTQSLNVLHEVLRAGRPHRRRFLDVDIARFSVATTTTNSLPRLFVAGPQSRRDGLAGMYLFTGNRLCAATRNLFENKFSDENRFCNYLILIIFFIALVLCKSLKSACLLTFALVKRQLSTKLSTGSVDRLKSAYETDS